MMGEVYDSNRETDILIARGSDDLNFDDVGPEDERTALLVTSSRVIAISYRAIETIPQDIGGVNTRKGSISSSIFTLVSTMIGGGLLSLPFAFQQGGIIFSSVVLFFTFLTSTYGAFLIINSKKYCSGQVRNIEDVAKYAFGRSGQIIVQLLLIILLYLSSVAYFILITEQVAPLISSIWPHSCMWTRKEVLLALVFAVVFPMSLGQNLSALRYTSGSSVVCGIFLCICVTYRCVTSGFGGPLKNPDNPIKWYPSSLSGFITCISIAEVGYSCHFNVLPMYTELAHQTRTNKRIILSVSMLLTYSMNAVISIFGYLQFREHTAQDITQNYSPFDKIVTFGRVAFCFVLLLSYPLLIVPCRATLNKIIWSKETRNESSRFLSLISNDHINGPNKLFWLVETFLLVGSSYFLAWVVPQVNMVWGIVGAVGCTTLIYILPPAFYLRVRGQNEKIGAGKRVFPVLLLVIGIGMLFVGIYQAVRNIVAPFEIVPLNVFSKDSNSTRHGFLPSERC